MIAKAAVSLDGSIASAAGVRTEISGPAARRAVQRLRAEIDAVGIGSGTLLVDDPWLTVREVFRFRPLMRVIFDRGLRTPPTSRIFSTREQGPIVVLTLEETQAARGAAADALRSAGAQIAAVSGPNLADALKQLADLGVSSILLEGGAALHAAAWDARMIDRVQLYVAPSAVGVGGVPAFGGRSISLHDLRNRRVEPCGDDVLIEGDVQWTY